MFRNLILYKLKPFTGELDALIEQFERIPARECGATEPTAQGWGRALPAGDACIHVAGDHWLIRLCTEQKILPGSAVKKDLNKRVELISEQQGYRPGKKQIKDMKEQLTLELLPKAFSRDSHTYAWLNHKEGWLAIDAGSAKKADEFIGLLLKTTDLLSLAPLNLAAPPHQAMIEWIDSGLAPDGFTLDQECELCEPVEGKPTVRYKAWNLDKPEVKALVRAGALPLKLAMSFGETVSFVLTNTFEIKRIKVTLAEQEHSSYEDRRHQEETNFFLTVQELSRMLSALIEACGGLIPEEGMPTH